MECDIKYLLRLWNMAVKHEWNAFLEQVARVSVYRSYERLLEYAIMVSLVFSHNVTAI